MPMRHVWASQSERAPRSVDTVLTSSEAIMSHLHVTWSHTGPGAEVANQSPSHPVSEGRSESTWQCRHKGKQSCAHRTDQPPGRPGLALGTI
ncbi:hypothetical protein PGTUg99_006698 [Puccinia graminis f. sp. tritici]|uniref:Uncharacterized protein n=1 Tax=Puccinia graminis f. sp. tritici TaxID=56615 RepID=A0A5B0Q8D1_PUCGR|nr:hypothetical protein PGTUg99_010337 [Puccinia graminis f. sp. tritici]KAA1114018.1 hypothetical protein PGTUg99_006698 [Puccinia graminis f. sp. tritici]